MSYDTASAAEMLRQEAAALRAAQVAHPHARLNGDPERLENTARLIAAAPQLVEALTLMMRAYATEDGAHLAHEAVRKAAIALAGATP